MVLGIRSLFVVFVAATFLLALFQNNVVYAQVQRGPRSSGLEIYFYSSPDSCYFGLKTGEIDIMAWPLTTDWIIQDAIADPDIILTPLTTTNMMCGFNFNINDTIDSYAGVP
jgi:ABC-type transport system substrate-binding protein